MAALLPFVGLLLLVYGILDPEKTPCFPRCPFFIATGWKCIGCGSQRALHDLLNLDISNAFRHNAFFVCFLPLACVYAYLLCFYPHTASKIDRNKPISWFFMTIILGWWVGRNLTSVLTVAAPS